MRNKIGDTIGLFVAGPVPDFLVRYRTATVRESVIFFQ
jgi:hypothetical protein